MSVVPKLAFFLPTADCGGAERMMIQLLRGVTELGIPVDLLMCRAAGEFMADIPRRARIVEFNVPKSEYAVLKIARYLRRERPHALLSRMMPANLAVLLANRISGTRTRVVITEACAFDSLVERGVMTRTVRWLYRWLYPQAAEIVTVAQEMSANLSQHLGLPLERFRLIYNPVVDDRLRRLAQEECQHPWLRKADCPVIVTAGRLVMEKDQTTLINAFAIARKARPLRLIIFGEGPERKRLESLRKSLGLEQYVDLPGTIENPYAAFRRASLFVLSSAFEGLPNVLIEALACGCPAVSTSCPTGPSEILDGGRCGLLASVADPPALAQAMLTSLDRAWDRSALIRRGEDFSRDRAVAQYLDALNYPQFAAQRARAA